MTSLEDKLNHVTRIDVSELENFRLVVDSHSADEASSLNITAKTREPFPVRLVDEGGNTTLKITSPHRGSGGRGFAFSNISGAYVTGALSSVDETTAPLEMTFSRAGGVDVEVRVALPPGKTIRISTPKNEITTRTPSSGGGGTRRISIDSEEAKEIYRATLREVGEKLREVGDKLKS